MDGYDRKSGLTLVQKIRLGTVLYRTRNYIAKRRLGWFGPACRRQTRTYLEEGGPF